MLVTIHRYIRELLNLFGALVADGMAKMKKTNKIRYIGDERTVDRFLK